MHVDAADDSSLLLERLRNNASTATVISHSTVNSGVATSPPTVLSMPNIDKVDAELEKLFFMT